MKKIIILAAALFVCGGVQAQDWLDALKKTATTAIDQVTGGQLTAKAIIGTWEYAKPGVKLGSSDLASELGGAAMESTVVSKLESAYQMAGIKPGACSFTFEAESDGEAKFSAVMGSHNLSGTYEYDAETHALTLHFASGALSKLGTFNGYAYLSGTDLQIVFPADKLVQLATMLGSKVSSLSSATALLQKYDNVCLGFAFTKAS